MIMGTRTAYRCRRCNVMFLKTEGSLGDILSWLQILFSTPTCPVCGSKDVLETQQ